MTGEYPFELDRFQLDAIAAVDAGQHVVVAAPTGSGKTVVAEHGIDVALANGGRAFYTTPIKALSNQKYRDLLDRYGAGRVGLLTGDNAIDGEAPVVVMTTEIVRNMIYARSGALDGVELIVIDEVHFLQDPYRGPVWEEVIIHLPAHVQLVCLSATVSNAADLAGWIETVRGPARAIVETTRPVRLDDYYLIGQRDEGRLRLLPTFAGGGANATAASLDAAAKPARGGDAARRGRHQHGARRVLYTPTRVETLSLLEQREMLPVIFFIFSRNQCDEAAGAVVDAGVSLTSAEERAAIRRILDVRLDGVDAADLVALGHERLVAEMEAGVAPHHAGMVPPFKEAVEQCFAAGLLRAVFATETLAVGVNLPARTVVIEKLTKFTGDHHELLTPAEYTQLTGRAGRRGIDELGNAVVLWNPFVSFERVAELAATRTFHLRSAFRPTYNMAANLISRYTPAEARHLLNLSFAQYQSDRDVVRLEARAERLERRLADARASAESSYGDIWEFRRLRAQEDGSAGGLTSRDDAAAGLQPGDVVHVKKGRFRGEAAMVASARRKAGMRLTVVTPGADVLYVTADDIVGPVASRATIELPAAFEPKSANYRRTVARALRAVAAGPAPRSRRATGSGLHPVELDPELRQRLSAAGKATRLERDLADVTARIERHHRSLGRDFDRVIAVLDRRGHVSTATDGSAWELTASGRMLSRIFHECDLVIVECLQRGCFDGLDPPALAGIVSTLVYEHRSPEPPAPPWFPNDTARRRYRLVAATSDDVAADERSRGLGEHRPPDPGFLAAAYGWVAGLSLDDLLDPDGRSGGGGPALTGGDFVRTMKQVIDLARQLADVAPDQATAAAANDVVRLARRGVVADAGVGAAR